MQQPKRFQAPTLAEAYEQVRESLGESAVILSTRKAFAPGLFGQPGRQFVEVVARVPKEAAAEAKRPTLDQDAAAHDLARSFAEAAAAAPMPEAARTQFAAFQQAAAPGDLSPAAIEAEPAASAAPAAASSEPWSRQLDQMRGMLEQLMADRMDARIADGSAAVRAMKDRLVRHGMPGALASTLLGEVDRAASGDEAALAAAVERRLAAKLPPTVNLNPQRRRALFLVGPGGAGKTTLAVRLALQLQREHGLRVVVAGTDVNRVGAPQQLTAFGAVTGLDARLCYAPDELAVILDEPGVDLVIVDTAGHTGLRRDRMAELSAMLQPARQRMVLLAVPATMKASDLQETVAAFSAVGVDGMAVTRCDETNHLGAAAAVALESSIGVAFTTHSEQVSDPAQPADNLALASAVVHARWPTPAPASTGGRPAAPRHLAKVG
jgi:flagellar biosynthesis protein FlhF